MEIITQLSGAEDGASGGMGLAGAKNPQPRTMWPETPQSLRTYSYADYSDDKNAPTYRYNKAAPPWHSCNYYNGFRLRWLGVGLLNWLPR